MRPIMVEIQVQRLDVIYEENVKGLMGWISLWVEDNSIYIQRASDI
jgi:hypothetical protein